jgi:aminoglycoside phosphotransferase family enzyme
VATTGAAAVAETHCAVVVLVGDRASKLKKPVDLGFLDFRSAAARHAACLREVELNRRLAPDVTSASPRSVVPTTPATGWS